VLFLLAVTVLTLVVLFILSRGGSSGGAGSAGARVESKSTARRATTTVHVATTVYDVALDPNWPAKGTSRFSDSAASKSIGDQLSAQSTTTAGASGLGRVTSSTPAGHGSSTTLRRSTTTVPARFTTTTRVTPRATVAPGTTAPVTTTAAAPTTSPETTPSSPPTP
jgi:hypothetical protein